MKEYLLSIFKTNSKGIIFIWILDAIDIFIGLFSTFLLGKSIDGLINGEYSWFYLFISVQAVVLILDYLNNYYDNRVYAAVSHKTILNYTKKAYKEGVDVSTVSARIGYIESLVDVIHGQIINILSILIGMCFIIGYLLLEGYYWILFITIIVAISSFCILWRVKDIILSTEKKLNDEEEKQVNCLETKKQSVIGRHILRLFSFSIKISDIDAKNSFWIALLHILHIGASLIILINGQEIITAGVIYTIIAYVNEFNSYTTSHCNRLPH